MSDTLAGNPHYERSHNEDSPEWAQVEATRALVHEQRTANLIALWTEPNADITPMGGINYGNIATQIKERLGL